MAIAVTLVPHSPNLASLYGCAIGIGLGAGALNTIINVWIIEMWKKKSPTVLQIPGLTFGIGTILSPLILKPYLRDPFSQRLEAVLIMNSTALNDSLSIKAVETFPYVYNESYEEWRRSLLTAPFVIFGSIQVFCK